MSDYTFRQIEDFYHKITTSYILDTERPTLPSLQSAIDLVEALESQYPYAEFTIQQNETGRYEITRTK